MVTEAGKELLRNTINTAKFHNRILEENEMWKQFELERGLTMMVSDDLIMNKAKKHHQCSKHRKKSKSINRERLRTNDISAPSSSRQADRWDHSGFRELYPHEADDQTSNSSSSGDAAEKWDHGGYLELYPEEANNIRNVTCKSKEHIKKKKKKRKHVEVSSSDTEIWEEFKMYKRKKAEKKSKAKSRTLTYDNHVKEFRKQMRNDKNSSDT